MLCSGLSLAGVVVRVDGLAVNGAALGGESPDPDQSDPSVVEVYVLVPWPIAIFPFAYALSMTLRATPALNAAHLATDASTHVGQSMSTRAKLAHCPIPHPTTN